MNTFDTDKPRNSIKAKGRAFKVVAKAPMASGVCFKVSLESRCSRDRRMYGTAKSAFDSTWHKERIQLLMWRQSFSVHTRGIGEI
jgi:hypothetical protein